MAKYECNLSGNIYQILESIHSGILNSSASVTYEDGSTITIDDVTCAVRVYERYSMLGSNRISLNITLLEKNNNIRLSSITSGGSQAMFFKINTIGEESFLDALKKVIAKIK